MAEEDDLYKLEDDWFYDSITRYKKLNMYELQNPICLMELADCGSVCFVGCTNQGLYELSELALPNKITSDLDIVKDGDLKLKCGTFVQNAISQIQMLKGQRKLIASRQQTPGVTLYNLAADSSTDEITESSAVPSALINPNFCLQENNAVLVTDSAEPAVLVDVTAGRTVQTFDTSSSTGLQSQLTPVFIHSSVFAACYKNSGSMVIQDIRQDSASQFVPVSSVGGEGIWTINSSYNSVTKTQTLSKVVVVSDNGCVIVFDTRDWITPIHKSQVKSIHNTPGKDIKLCVRFKNNDSNIVSLSGCDGNVYVFDISKEIAEAVFVHDGHRHVEGCDPSTVTRCHAWLPYQDNYLISAALNRTVQCWQFGS